MDDIESLAFKNKSKEELELEWQEFEREQTRLFEDLIKEQKNNDNNNKISNMQGGWEALPL